jgi:hypothetical protein
MNRNGRLKDSDHMENSVIHGKMLRKELVWDAMDWIYLVQYRERRQAVLNTAVLLGFMKGGEFVHQLPVMEVTRCLMLASH